MKQGIHPDYKQATITCACGNTIETMSTEEEIHVEICSVCHPFYTGKQRLVDTAGRVERFKRKYGDTSSAAREEAEAEAEAAAEAEEAAEAAEEAPEGKAKAPEAIESQPVVEPEEVEGETVAAGAAAEAEGEAEAEEAEKG